MAISTYPLLFGFRDCVFGKGYAAGVSTDGRALLRKEPEGDFWMYGVSPGGVAGGGSDQQRAYQTFRENFRAVLFDFAEEAESFEEFEELVRKFFNAVNKPREVEWNVALLAVRSGEIDADWLCKKSADSSPVQVQVKRLQHLTPDLNELDQDPRVAAA